MSTHADGNLNLTNTDGDLFELLTVAETTDTCIVQGSPSISPTVRYCKNHCFCYWWLKGKSGVTGSAVTSGRTVIVYVTIPSSSISVGGGSNDSEDFISVPY